MSSASNAHWVRPSRRQVLKCGLLGSAMFAGVGALSSLKPPAVMSGRTVVQDSDARMLVRLAPALLGNSYPGTTQAGTELVNEIEHYFAHLPTHARIEVRQLFDLLQTGLTRIPLTGVWDSWAYATDDDIADFLQDWRHSRFATLRAGYRVLRDTVTSAWYGLPNNWPPVGYPGPPLHLLAKGKVA